jgi:hypothetical protein
MSYTYEYAEYSASVVINNKCSDALDVCNNMMRQKMECARHQMNYLMAGKPYRLYRRGKNRCLGCGVKLG